MQKHIRKKTLETLGLTEEDHTVKFSCKQVAPSLPPSPGRPAESDFTFLPRARKVATAFPGRRVELPPPSAETVAQIHGATPSKRARRILQMCCSTKNSRAEI